MLLIFCLILLSMCSTFGPELMRIVGEPLKKTLLIQQVSEWIQPLLMDFLSYLIILRFAKN